MADTTDLVSAVGTWLGVGLAMVALIGVVAPILIWRATKSERNEAINTAAEGGAEAFGYVSRGLWTGRKVRIFRRVRAPLLAGKPVLRSDAPADTVLRFGTGTEAAAQAELPELSAGWMQFASVVEAYNIDVAKGDNLEVEDGYTWAPVHTSWLLLVGLVGRFGKWQDKGRFPRVVEPGTTSTQARIRAPGMVLLGGHADANRRHRPNEGWMTGVPWKKSEQPRQDSKDYRLVNGMRYRPLYGLTGTLYTPQPHRESYNRNAYPNQDNEQRTAKPKKVFFSRHNKGRVGNLGDDTVSVDWLFWMAVGCIPTAQKMVLCLADAVDRSMTPDTPSVPDILEDERTPVVRFQTDNDTNYSPSSDSEEFELREDEVSPAMYVRPDAHAGNAATTALLDPHRPRAFRLSPSYDTLDDLAGFAELVHAEQSGTKVLSLEEVGLEEDELRNLVTDNGTYITRSSEWLRLHQDSSDKRKFLHRADGQTMAAALLTLPLSPYGYLMSLERCLCREMLCQAADSLPQLLLRTMWSIDGSFDFLEDDVKQQLRNTMASFSALSQPVKRTRLYFEALYKLNRELEAAIGQDQSSKQISLSLGCVMITSPEFRSLVSQSVRLLEEGFHGTMCVDLDVGVVEVSTVMNFPAKFPVDVKAIFPGIDATERRGRFDIPLPRIALICFKAALRSAMLDSALDSRPLFEVASNFGFGQTALMG